jgi:type I restriction enzyme M protein
LSQLHTAVCTLPAALNQLDAPFTGLHTAVAQLAATAQPTEGHAASNGDSPSLTPATIAAFQQQVADLAADGQAFQQERADLLQELTDCTADIPVRSPAGKMPTAQEQHAARAQLDPFIPRLKAMQKTITVLVREAGRARDTAEKELNGRQATTWDGKTARTALADLEAARDTAAAALKEIINWHSQANWLQSRFPDGVYGDVLGLCKVVSRADIAAHDDSLTPGRYVGVAPLELEDDEDFEERMAEIHIELEDLNQEAFELASTIKTNFEDLGI